MKIPPYLALRVHALLALSVVAFLCLTSYAKAEQPVRLRGYVAAKTVDCLNPTCHDHAPNYYLHDEASGERVRIKGYDKQLKGLHPLQKISIKGVRRANATQNAAKKKTGKPTQAGTADSGAELEIQELEILPVAEKGEVAEEPGPIAESGANTLTMLSTLLVFISTDTHGCMTSETNARGRLFDNTNNANEGMQAITKGRHGIQLGKGTGLPQDEVINLTLNVNSADHNTDSIEDLAVAKLFNSVASGGMGLSRTSWNRILLFAPAGITDSGFTAYAYYPWGSYTTAGMVSMYGNSYGNNRMNGYLHELGHNFGFGHSSKGGSTYGDRTCVMGVSNDGTRTETYNAAKLLEKDWLDVFPNAQLSVTTDITVDLYPLSSDPNVVNEAIAVDFPGTDYYAAYHRNQEPYGYLSQGGDRDKFFVYTRAAGDNQRSYQVANIAEGGSYTGPGTVHFERYGPNNEYATVSFDMNDGNAKPVADAQSVNATINTNLGITLTGSDSDTGPPDTLTYTVVTNPANGSLSGTAPNLTYSPNTDYVGADSFVFKLDDGQISSFATISITVNVVNTPPVADDQSVSVYYETPEPITLTASDANGHSLSYSVVAGPSSGALSGTPPNLTYTPNNTFSGNDSFTFKANDGQADSNTATVSITVSATPNTAPSVEAGPNQAILLQAVTNTPGLYYGTVAGNIDESTANPESQLLVNPSTETENSIASNTTEIYTGNIYDADGQISFTEHIDDKARIWVDGVLVLSNDSWNSRSSTANLNLAPGWHTFEIRISNGTGGAGPVGGEIGIGYDPNGGTAWQTLTDPGDGSFLRVNQSSSSAVATLNGTSVTDPEHSPSYAWSDTGTGTGTGLVTFSDANALSPTVTFTEVGTYILRLTADDGYTQSFDEVTITVTLASNDPPVTDAGPDQTVYMTGASWSAGITYDPITDDADSGISSDKTYTHAVDFGSDATRALINGVQFQAGGTTFGDKAGTSATVGTGTTTIPSPHVGNTGAAAYLNGASPCGMEDLVKDMNYNNGTAVITLTGLTPGVHYKFKLYHRVWSGTRIQNIGFDTDGVGTNISGAEYTGTFDQDDATVPDPGFATATQVYALTLDYSLPSGVTSLNVYIDNVSGGTYHLYGLTNEVDSSTGASATLDGTVTDGEQTPTGSWSVVGGNASAVTFADANAIDTTAIFTEAGTYTLQLTGDDGYETSTDTVTIIVNPPLPTIYATWTSGTFSNSFDIIGIADNPDGDSSSNFMEFAFGTDPTSRDGGSLAINGSSNGNPMAAEGAGAAMELYFVRRDDHGTSGSVSYTVQFSDDLSTFTDSLTSPSFVADSSENSDYEVVKVPFPPGSTFGRIRIEAAP